MIVLVVLSLVTAGVLIGRTDAGRDLFGRARDAVEGDEQGAGAGSSGAADNGVTIAAVRSFDPQGTGTPGENDEAVPLAHDGDPGTAWTTEGYNNRNLAPKDGVGLVVELGQPTALDEVTLSSSTQDWAVEVFVADSPSESLGGWGDPVATADGIDGDAVLDLDGATGASVLIWITDLGNGPPRVKADIADMAFAAT